MKSSQAIIAMFIAVLIAGCSTPQALPEHKESGRNVSSAMQWKTYTNAKYGFAFQHPSDWTVKEKIDDRNNIEVLNVYASNIPYRDDQYYWALDEGQALFMVSVQPKNDILPWGGRLEAEKNFKLDGIDAHKGSYELTDGGPGSGTPTAIEVSAYKNDIEYIINLVPPTGPFTETFDQMLSMFTFTR